MTDLTEQWKKGELNRNKIYYYETPFNTSDTASGFWLCNHLDTEKDKVQILGEVPSYEEWKLMQDDNKRLKHDVGNLGYKIKNQRKEIDNRLKEIEKLKERNDSLNNRDINLCRIANGIRDENFALKDLLKECELWFTGIVGNMNDKNVGEHNRSVPIGNFEYIFNEFSRKIKEVLK